MHSHCHCKTMHEYHKKYARRILDSENGWSAIMELVHIYMVGWKYVLHYSLIDEHAFTHDHFDGVSARSSWALQFFNV
jgi:hypothetical protein